MATNTYIQSLAQLIDQDLNPNLTVYVEYSNETWNNDFAQYSEVLAAAEKQPPGDRKEQRRVCRCPADRFPDQELIGLIFKQAFGSEASRVHAGPRRLGGRTPTITRWRSQFLQTNYGSVSNSIADFAIAPYVVLTSGTDVPGLTMAGLFNSMENYLDTNVSSWLTANESLAKTYGVPVIGYEGGQGLYPGSSKNPALETAGPERIRACTLSTRT